MATSPGEDNNPASESGGAAAEPPKSGPRFSDMQLAVGTRLQLLGSPRTGPAQCFTMLIGYVRNEYLLLQLPREKGMTITYKPGEELMVRVFSGTSVFTFPATVERVLLAPLFQLYLSFPAAIESTALRAGIRVKVEIAATATVPGQAADEPPVTAMITNLSRNGALLEADRSLGGVDDKITVAFDFHPDVAVEAVKVNSEATIRSMRERTSSLPGATPRFEHGLQLALDSSQQMMVQNYIYEMLLADRQKIV